MRYTTIKYFFISKLGLPTNPEALNAYINFCINHHIDGDLCENHHILPRSTHPEFVDLGLHPFNCSRLNLSDHVRAHELLYYAYPENRTFYSAKELMQLCIENRIELFKPVVTIPQQSTKKISKKPRKTRVISEETRKKMVAGINRTTSIKRARPEIPIIEKYIKCFNLKLNDGVWRMRATTYLISIIEEFQRVFHGIELQDNIEFDNILLERMKLLTVAKCEILRKQDTPKGDLSLIPGYSEIYEKLISAVGFIRPITYRVHYRILYCMRMPLDELNQKINRVIKRLKRSVPLTKTEQGRVYRARKKLLQ